MPRTEARIFTSIWRDPQFLALDGSAQRLYMFLLSQEDLTYCGVMALRPGWWAKKASGLTVSDIEQGLKALEAAECRFVIVDADEEKLLIRSFMRNDEVWKQPNLMKAARSAAALVESAMIRAALLAELLRIPAPSSPSRLVREVHADFLRDLSDPSANPSGNPSADPDGDIPAGQTVAGNPSANPSAKGSAKSTANPEAKPSANPSQEKGDGYSPKQGNPFTPELLPTGEAGKGSANPSAKGSSEVAADTAQTLVAEWLDHCRKRPPQRVIGQVAKELGLLLAEGQDVEDVRRGLAQWHAAAKHPSTLASFVNEAMNGSSTGRKSDRGSLPANVSPRDEHRLRR
jgi:hypothetical protein